MNRVIIVAHIFFIALYSQITHAGSLTTVTGGGSVTAVQNTNYIFSDGTYTYTIAGFAIGNKLIFPTGNAPTVDNNNFSDGSITVQYYTASKNLISVKLTSLTIVQDSTMYDLNSFKSVFGSDSISTSTYYQLTIAKSGSGSGTVTPSSGSIDWTGSLGTASYASGNTVTLTAAADNGSNFSSWSGCDNSSGNSCTVTMNSAKSVTTTFGQNGVCGSANNTTVTAAPSTNLCTTGTNTTVTGTGPWYWFCSGSNGGLNASCSANKQTQTWTVTPTAGTNGSITPNTQQTVNSGATTSFTITPNNGYQIVTPVGGTCGGTLTGSIYTTNAVTAACGVSATFIASKYTITSSVTSGSGVISCTSPVTSGGSSTCTVIPATGYQLATFTDNGINAKSSVTANSYSITNVTTNHTITATFTLNNPDTTPPTATITFPINGSSDKILSSISGTATDNAGGSGVSKVEVKIYNETLKQYINSDGVFTLNPDTWIQISPITGTIWQLNTANFTSINGSLTTANGIYAITARATDVAKNVSWETTITFNRVDQLHGTKLVATPLATVLLAKGTTTTTGATTTTVQGQLTLQDTTNNISLLNQPVTVTIKDSNGNDVPGSPFSDVTTDTAGHFSISGVGNIATSDNYKLQAHFLSSTTQGAGLLSSHSPEYTITVGSQPGYAVIVQGRIVSGEGMQAHARTANRIYKALKERGFQASNIKYLGPVATNPDSATANGVTLESTPVSALTIQNAIAWAANQMVSSAAPFYLIMVDHGVNGAFRIDTGSSVVPIDPQTLNGWLSVLDKDPTVAAQKQVIMIGSCYSGSFIEPLKRKGRVVITSAAFNEESYKGPLEQPGNVRSGEYFLDALFHELRAGFSLTSAFRTAAGKTRDFTREGWELSSNGLYGDNAVQHPLLDDTGDGIGYNQISDQFGKGSLASSMYLGVGDTRTNAAEPGEILSVTLTDTLPTGKSSQTLWLKHIIGSQGSDNAVSAWAEVRRPDVVIQAQKNKVTEQVALSLDTVPLAIIGDMASGSYSSFTTPGKYEIFYYTRKLSGAISEVRRSVIYKKDNEAFAPLAFSPLLPPLNDSTQKTNGVVLSWNPTTDGDNDQQYRTPVTYTLLVCGNPSCDSSNYAYYNKIEELTDNFAKLDSTDGITDGKQYFWKVIATDLYGNTTETAMWNFTVNDNINPPTRYFYKGTVRNSVTLAQVNGAVVSITDSSMPWPAIKGSYLVSNFSSSQSTIKATHSDYHASSIIVAPQYNSTGKSEVDNTIYLDPIITPGIGTCGSDDGNTLAITPANLCTTGTASTVTGNGPWNWSCNGSNGGTTVTCTAYSSTTTTTTKAKIFLGTGDNFTVSNSGAILYGSTGINEVTITSDVTGVTLDQNIERINFPDEASSYTFKQTGNLINVYNAFGILVVKAPVQGDSDGTVLSFNNNVASALLTGGGIMTLGGVTVSSGTATMLSPATTLGTPSTANSTKAKVYLGTEDNFTVSNSGATIYGNTGTETVTIATGISGVILDQNIERINFSGTKSSYTFRQTGNIINVHDATTGNLIVKAPVQGDDDGTVLSFSGGTPPASAKLSGGVMTLGDVEVQR